MTRHLMKVSDELMSERMSDDDDVMMVPATFLLRKS